jgi:hypothetical protein
MREMVSSSARVTSRRAWMKRPRSARRALVQGLEAAACGLDRGSRPSGGPRGRSWSRHRSPRPWRRTAARPRSGASVPSVARRATTCSTICAMRRSSTASSVQAGRGARDVASILAVEDVAAHFEDVDDGHDGGVHGAVLGDRGLTGRGAAGVEHDLTHTRLPTASTATTPPSLTAPVRTSIGATARSLSPVSSSSLRDATTVPMTLPMTMGSRSPTWRGRGAARESMLAWGRGMTWTLTSSPTRSAARAPASVAAFTAATSPRTIAVV